MNKTVKKILLLSTSDLEGGAAKAIYKLSEMFNKEGHQVAMLVKNKTEVSDFVVEYNYTPQIKLKQKSKTVRRLNKLVKIIFPQKKEKLCEVFYDNKYCFYSIDETSQNVLSSEIINQIGFIPDYIFTGWTCDFINSTDLLNLQKETNAKVYNIMVDMNHFTGGCHYAWDCKGYINGCTTDCPAIIGNCERDKAKMNFEIKRKNAIEGKFQIIVGSDWTLKQAKESLIYKEQSDILNINSLIDTTIFNDNCRVFAKKIFNLDNKYFYILTGSTDSTDPRKGFDYLVDALNLFYDGLTEQQRERVRVLIVTKITSGKQINIPFETQHIEYITDYRLLSLLYQAADLYVNSSIEDAGPMMVSEALACGTPVVGFDMGVVSNMVINDYNGYKAILKNSNDLANGISTVFKLNKETYTVYSNHSVKQVEEFSSMTYAKELLNQIMNN